MPARARRPGRHAPGRQPARDPGKGGGDPGLIPITVPEVRRLFLALTGSREQRRFRLRWSVWRRAHQAIAARCHAQRRAQAPDRPLIRLAPVPPASGPAELTDAEWERIRPLLPPQRPLTGRPRHDHRTLLSGILWVLRTRSSWRDMPLAFGNWETAYKRYRLWCDSGLWQRLLALLDDAPVDASTGATLQGLFAEL